MIFFPYAFQSVQHLSKMVLSLTTIITTWLHSRMLLPPSAFLGIQQSGRTFLLHLFISASSGILILTTYPWPNLNDKSILQKYLSSSVTILLLVFSRSVH